MKFQFLILGLLFFLVGYGQETATVTGTVTDRDMNNESLPFATVTVKGTTISVNTDETGSYTLTVPAGTHTIVFGFLGYKDQEVEISVAAGETKTINQQLFSDSVQLQDVVLEKTVNREKETALLLAQKNAVEIKQSIGSQEIARKGISDVEEGLTKITGISKVETRGLFIRGLENRYNNLLINGLAVPSNSPFNKIIPLDLFPTDIVGYMDVFKTFNPDIYGDFAGGTVDIHTSQITGSRTKVTIGTGYTTNNNLNNFRMASDSRDAGNFFGFPGDDRDLPGFFTAVPSAQSVPGAQSSQVFKSGFNVEETKSPLNTSVGVTHSGRFNYGENDANTFSYLFSTNFENKYSVRKGADRIFQQEGGGIYDNNLQRTQYRMQTYSSSLLGMQLRTPRGRYNFNTLYIRSTDNLIQDQIGYTRNQVQNPNEIIRLNQYEQSDYLSTQLLGQYNLTEDERHSIEAGVSFTTTKFKQPDRKFINGTLIGEDQIQYNYGGNNLIRQFLQVDGDYFVSGRAEYNYKFGGKEDSDLDPYRLSIGYNGYINKLESTYRFVFGRPNGASPTMVTPLNEIDPYLQSDAQSNLFVYQEESNPDYNTKIEQFINAGYVNMLFKLSEKFELNAGVRVESTQRDLYYRPILDPISRPLTNQPLNQTDFLPSVNSKYSFNDKLNLRFAASKTLTRPVLIETIPIQYINADGTTEKGNKDLKNSANYNADLKIEYYPSQKELLSATVFAKYVDKPIERTIEGSATGSGQIITYFNNKNATLFGVELEALLQLNRVTPAMEGFAFGFNTSLMYTNSVTDKNRVGYQDTFEERKLQGASTWLINSDLRYDVDFTENWKNVMSLVYNVYGKRIYAVGVNNYDHIYEMPFSKLDFVWTSTMGTNWEIRFSADNLLDPVYRVELGDESKIAINEQSLVLRDYRRGIGFSLNLSYTF